MLYRTICCVLILVLHLGAQKLQGADEAVGSDFPEIDASRDYRIGPNDLLGIKIFGVEDLDQVVRVGSSGLISIPYLGRVFVAGLTGGEVEDRIGKNLAAKELVRDPQVTVFIQEYNSQPIHVLGAVNQPGQYMLTHHLSVVDAISMAGGLDREKAGKYILVRRGKGLFDPATSERGSEAKAVFRIDLKALLDEGNVSQDISLRGGDVIQVPVRKAEVYYVIGEVTRPGAFEISPNGDDELLAARAVGWAGGPSKTAKLRDSVVLRYADGKREEIPLDLRAILQGGAADISIQPNDIIFVPGSKVKTFGWGLLTVLPPTMSGVAIWNSGRQR
jgi:polysaccharide export outer membrane protein